MCEKTNWYCLLIFSYKLVSYSNFIIYDAIILKLNVCKCF